HRIGQSVGGGGEIGDEIVDLVPPRVLPGQNAGPADGADRRRDEMVAKQDAFASERIEVRRPGELVAGAAEHVPAQIVGQKEDDVRPFLLRLLGRGGRAEDNVAQYDERQRGHAGHGHSPRRASWPRTASGALVTIDRTLPSAFKNWQTPVW